MRKPPSINDLYKYPVVAALALAAVGLSCAWWNKMDVEWALMSPLLFEGQVWRLFTSILPHVDLLHLAFNLYWFWIFGTLFEPAFGWRSFVGIVLVLAAGSSLAEYTFSSGGVGLSGVGYGLFGMAWVLCHGDERFKKAVDGPTIFLFLVWFLFCIFLTYKGLANIGNVAHGAGLVLGLLLGWRVLRMGRSLVPTLLIAALLCLTLLGTITLRSHFISPEVAAEEQAELGYRYLLAKRYERARDSLQRSLSLDDRNPDAWFNLGIAQDQMGNIEEAVEAFQQSYNRKANSESRKTLVSALVSAATIEQQANRHKEAVSYFQRAVALDSGNATTWYNLGCSLQRVEQQEKALEAFAQAWKRDPHNPHFQTGFLYLTAEHKK